MTRHVGRVVVVSSLAVAMATTMAGTAPAAQGGPLSKKAYIKAGDNICRQVNQLSAEAYATEFAGLGPDETPSVEQATAYVSDLEPIIHQELDSLRALPAPTADKKRLKKIYKLVEKALDALVADPSVLLNGTNPFEKAGKAAGKYGFKVCGTSKE